MALLQGMEYAADPNGDGDTSDRADIINMSLGSPYGQPFDDDLAAAVQGATKLGILTVASAGNSGDKPYVTGSPGAAPSALSVAQTAVPSDFQPYFDVTAPADIAGSYPAVYQSWSAPLTSVVESTMQYGDGASGNLNGCAAFEAGSLAGKIVLVDRGVCDFSLKISNIAAGNGLIGIIGLIAPGDPFEGSLGDGYAQHPRLHDQPGTFEQPEGRPARHDAALRSEQRRAARHGHGRQFVAWTEQLLQRDQA